jgi:hypothetical protein
MPLLQLQEDFRHSSSNHVILLTIRERPVVLEWVKGVLPSFRGIGILYANHKEAIWRR